MAYRQRHRGTTQQRGYGTEHQRLRKRLLERWRPGDPCTRCGRAMWDRRYIDLAHTPDRTAYEGLQHRACNRGEGASRGNRMRGMVWRHARRW